MSETTPARTPASVAAELAAKLKTADEQCVPVNLGDAVKLLSEFATLAAGVIEPTPVA